MDDFLQDVLHEFRRCRSLAERAMAPLSDEEFFRQPTPHVNSAAIIVKHVAGNLLSRWTDFLTTDGEKGSRDRDGEFQLGAEDTREHLLAAWNRGWDTLLDAVEDLTGADLGKSITIRGEPHTVGQALLRGLSHIAYHTGQTLYVVRLLRLDSPWLTIAPGQSRSQRGAYRDNPTPDVHHRRDVGAAGDSSIGPGVIVRALGEP